MLDLAARRHLDPWLERIARRLDAWGATPNGLTWAGFAFAVLAFVAVWVGGFWLALALVLASRACDGLDGTLARVSGRGGTDYGGFLDICLDFGFYGLIPLGFALHDPGTNAVAACVLILTFYVNGGTVLAFAIMAEKRGVEAGARGDKSLLFTIGLAEGTETITVFVAMCVFPGAFVWIAFGFAALCAVTAGTRIALAARRFGAS